MLSLILSTSVIALDNTVGKTPAMGYNTWNDFRCHDITDKNVRLVADKIVSLGLDKLGYQYVNIDDCWTNERGKDGVLIPDVKAFPNGMKVVADYVHSKGLKFGIYTDRGQLTCQKRPASLGHEAVDAKTFASWGVDYLKEDSCNATQDHDTAFAQYATMRDALNKTGRPIYFSLCGWQDWYAPKGFSLGNSWRVSGDVNGWVSVWDAIKINSKLAKFAKPGGWNDPDMLVGSNPKAASHNTPDQARTQFSLWSIMAAPLLIGSNIINISAWDLETYSNAEVIKIDQDSLGVQGEILWENCPDVKASVPNCQQVWGKPLAGGKWATAFVNYDSHNTTTVRCDSTCLGKMKFAATDKINVRDVWTHKDLAQVSGTLSASIKAGGASAVFVLSK